MMSPADRLVDATLEYTLRPKRGNRQKVITAVLEFIIQEYGHGLGSDSTDVIDVQDLEDLIKEFKETVTVEELSQVRSGINLGKV